LFFIRELAKEIHTSYIVLLNSWHTRYGTYIISEPNSTILWNPSFAQLKFKAENHTENSTSKMQTPWNRPTENWPYFH
jgi:hypothetical protein